MSIINKFKVSIIEVALVGTILTSMVIAERHNAQQSSFSDTQTTEELPN